MEVIIILCLSDISDAITWIGLQQPSLLTATRGDLEFDLLLESIFYQNNFHNIPCHKSFPRLWELVDHNSHPDPKSSVCISFADSNTFYINLKAHFHCSIITTSLWLLLQVIYINQILKLITPVKDGHLPNTVLSKTTHTKVTIQNAVGCSYNKTGIRLAKSMHSYVLTNEKH